MATMRYQPQGLIRLNRSNPLARGLVAAYVPRSGPRDATGTLATLVDASPVLSSLGYVTPPLSSGPYPVVGTFPNSRTESFSVFVLGRFSVSSDSNIAPTVSVAQVGQLSGWKFGPAGTGGNLGLTLFGVADYVTSVAFPASGSIGFSAIPAANVRIFSSGAFRQQITISSSAASATTARMGVGQRGDGLADSTSASQVALALYWNRALSDAEQASLAANPWQLFDAPDDDEYVLAAAAPSNSTGTFAATLAAPSMASAGLVTVPGTLAATLAAPTFAASGIASTPPSGTFAASMPAPVMTSTGIALDAGQFSTTMPAPVMAAIGAVAPNVTGTMAFTMPAPTMNSFGFLGSVAPAAPVRPYRWRILRRNFAQIQ